MMTANADEDTQAAERRLGLVRLAGAMPWLKPVEKKRYRARVFKSGNSIAVRIPSGTKLAAGMEMELIIEDGEYLSLQPIHPPKRKFDIAKVAGSATQLNVIRDEDRFFEEHPLAWDGPPDLAKL